MLHVGCVYRVNEGIMLLHGLNDKYNAFILSECNSYDVYIKWVLSKMCLHRLSNGAVTNMWLLRWLNVRTICLHPLNDGCKTFIAAQHPVQCVCLEWMMDIILVTRVKNWYNVFVLTEQWICWFYTKVDAQYNAFQHRWLWMWAWKTVFL